MKTLSLLRPLFSLTTAVMILFLTGCGDDQESAADTLKEKDLDFTVEDYLLAAQSGDLKSVKLFQEAGMEVDTADAAGNTALLRAAGGGHPDLVKWLLDAGADPRLANRNDRTPLIAAAESGHTEAARLLLGRGADIAATDIEGWNALALAAYNGHPDMVEVLAARVDQENLDNALLVSSFKGNIAVIDHLLNHGAYVNTRSPADQTPLMIAAQSGHEDAVKLLLQNQANPYALDENEKTAANLAEAGGHNDLSDLLLDPTANWTATTVSEDEAATASTLRALDGTADVLDDNPDSTMTALNGAVLDEKENASVSALKMHGYREEPLPVMLKGVDSGTARVRVLSSSSDTPVEVQPGDMIPDTNLKVTDMSNQFVNSKQGKGEPVDVSRITVENTDTGARHMLVKDVPGRSSDTYAVLTLPGSSFRYVVKSGDVFRAVTEEKGEQDFKVMDIRPTQVVIQDIATEEVLTIQRDGIAMN